MGKPCRGMRGNWTEDMMIQALALLKKGKSQRYVEQKCGIPRTTLRNHLKTGNSQRKLGRHAILSQTQEIQLEQRIIRMANVGVPLTPKAVRRSVFRFCIDNNIPHKFNNSKEMAGFTWYKRFLKRHPKLRPRKPQLMNHARAQKMNPAIVKDHFEKLGKVIGDMGIRNSPQYIYNIDQKGCRLTLHSNRTVLAQKGERRVHLVANEHAETVTVVACINALGHAIPPMILFKGKRKKESYEEHLPPGSVVEMSIKGSMTKETFIKWIQHFAKFKIPGNVLLIMDGVKCHIDISIVAEAERHNISLYCLPSNTTHELQPFDKAVFRSFEHHWDVELMKYWEQNPNSLRRLKKEKFGIVLNKVWQQCMSISNIQSGFRATGIYPFDPTVIPETAFLRSILSHNECGRNKTQVNEIESSDSEGDIPLINLVKNQSPSHSKASEAKPGCSKWTDTPMVPKSDSVHSSKVKILNVTVIKPSNSAEYTRQASNFESLLKTPDMAVKKEQSVPRKKSINYKAQLLKKDLFSSTATKEISISKEFKKSEESWLCSICNNDFQADMRRCSVCNTWVHEMCVGLTADDLEDFRCPNCMD